MEKKRSCAAAAPGSFGSYWSAPKLEMLALMPAVAMGSSPMTPTK